MADPFNINIQEPVGKSASLVGGYFPCQMADYLRLLAVYYNTTTSDILRRIVQEWIENKEPEDSLIRILASRAYREWQQRLNEKQAQNGWRNQDDLYKRFCEFEQEMKQTLNKRHITAPKIMEVIEKMEEIYGV